MKRGRGPGCHASPLVHVGVVVSLLLIAAPSLALYHGAGSLPGRAGPVPALGPAATSSPASRNQVDSVLGPAAPGVSPPLETQYTLFLRNQTLRPGDVLPSPRFEPWYVAYDPTLDLLYMVSDCKVYIVNPSTLSVEGTLRAANGCGVLYLSSTGDLYLSNRSHIAIVDPANDSLVSRISAPQAGQTTYGLFVYDPLANAIVVGNALNESANVVNLTLGRVVAKLSTDILVVDGAYDPVNKELYLANYENNSLAIVNSTTWATTTVALSDTYFGFMQGVTVDSQTGNVYLTTEFYCPGCFGTDYVVEVSGSTSAVLNATSIGAYATGIVYDSGNGLLYVACSVQDRIYALTANLSLAATISVNAPSIGLTGEWWLSYVPQLDTIFAPTSYQASLVAISDESQEVYATLGGLTEPLAIAWDPILGCAVIGDYFANRLYFVNATRYEVVQEVSLGGSPRGITYDPRTGDFWVGLGGLTGDGGIAIVNGTTGAVNSSLESKVWNNAPAYDPEQDRMFAPTITSNVVDIYNASSLTLVGNVVLGDQTNAAFDPGNDRVYVSDESANNVSVINASSDGFLENITGVPGPDSIVYDGATSHVYTADESAPNITAIDPTSDEIARNYRFTYPDELLPGESGTSLYVTGGDSNITDLNLSDGAVDQLAAGAETYGLAWLPSGVLAATDLNGTAYFLSGESTAALTTPILSILPSRLAADAATEVTTTVTGGVAPLEYLYAGLPANCVAPNATRFSCSPTTEGVYNVSVTVKDAEGARTTATAMMWVGSASSYPVSFTESGLPAGTRWWVNLSVTQTFSSTTTTLQFSLPNGSYDYSVRSAQPSYLPSMATGSLSVAGHSVRVSERFSEREYEVTFTESGLPSASDWWLNVTGGSSTLSMSATVQVDLVNGTYAYSIATSDHEYAPTLARGSFEVAGAPVDESATFLEVTCTVTFTETGVPGGESWWLNLTNGQTFSTTSPALSFGEPNGSFTYTASAPGYHTVSGSFTVAGQTSESVTVTFQPIPAAHGPPYLLVAIGIAAAAAVIGGVYLVARRRKRTPPPSA